MTRHGVIKAETLFALDGVRLNLFRAETADSDNSSRIVMLLLPGWCMPATIWHGTMLAMAPDAEVIALDPRGQGASDVPESGYHINQRADDIAQCLAHSIGPARKVVLVGWSLGALEALHYVHRHGESRLNGLVLVDSSVGEEPSTPPALGFRADLRKDRRSALERFVRAMFRTPRSEAEISNLTKDALRMPLEASLELFPSHLPREHWREIARTFRAPLLYAVTSQFAAQAENLKKARPATQIEIFPEAGHALFIDAAAGFNQLLRNFLRRWKIRN